MLNPKIWGPSAWKFLHSVTLSYPQVPNDDDKYHYLQFFDHLRAVLPCQLCRDNYNKYWYEYPLTQHIYSREALSKWFLAYHNKVNERLGKSVMTYDEFLSSFANTATVTMNKRIIYGGIIVIAIVYLYMKFNGMKGLALGN